MLKALILICLTTSISFAHQEDEQPFTGNSNSFTVEQIFKTLAEVYPNIVKRVPKSENPHHPDLAINVRGIVFYNVEGRFLPEHERENWQRYSPNTIYQYPKEIPDPLLRSSEEMARIRELSSKSNRSSRKPTYNGFNEALYGMSKLADTNSQIMKSRFLGKQVVIHQFTYEALKQIEKEIYQISNQKDVQQYLKEGDTVYSFFWRNVAGTKSRSLHSYGMAIDVTMHKTKKAIYWLWRQNLKIDWVKEPLSVRWGPPKSVVDIFEKYGFVWGGKWIFYDTMHFEYRPEVLILNGFNVKLLSHQQIEL